MNLLSEDRSPTETLNYSLARERGQANQQKMNNSKSPQSSTYRDNPWFDTVQYIKRQNRVPILPTPQTGQVQNCRRCGNKFLPGHLNICPAKTKLAEYARKSATLQNYVGQKYHHALHSDHKTEYNQRTRYHNHSKDTTNWHKDKHNIK